MTTTPTAAPAGFVPLAAVAFSDGQRNGRAVNAADPLPVTGMDFYERLVREGEPWSAYASGSAAVAAGAVNTGIATAAPAPSPVGKAFWVESVTVSLASRAIGQVSVPNDASGRFNQLVQQFVSGDGGAATIPIRRLHRGFSTSSNYSALLSVRRLLDPDGLASAAGRNIYGAVSVTGFALTDDLNFDADRTILVLGDSILNGTGPTTTANMWTFLARDHFKAQGPSVRLVQMQSSGSTTSEHETWRAAGRYDGVEADMVVYALGVNDAGAAVPTATYRANLEAMWAHVQKRWPAATMIVCGVTPLENALSDAHAELLRAEAADFVADAANARLKYVALGTAFDRLDASFYVGSDTPGSRVHPDNDGHAAIAAAFNAAVDAQGISFS